ncbi:hypothetical protein [Brevibacillus laterosporus]|uniref:hypothetical protein n=1 Tax=Brevibacillus laterosporus TaxID=1465 RepID=UPI001F5506E6|nr:hypothetical protein [Brevibacillus laterosporus]
MKTIKRSLSFCDEKGEHRLVHSVFLQITEKVKTIVDANVMIAIIGGAVSLGTGFIGYISGRNNNQKDVSISDRQLLSQAEQAFRAELREELRIYKEEIKALKQEIEVLRQENFKLLTENRSLNTKVESLMSRLGGEQNK